MYPRVAEAMASTDVAPGALASAKQHLAEWLEESADNAYLDAIDALVEQGNGSELVDSFYRVLPFGTGGRRGPVGVGQNRINPRTVGTCIEGHAN